MEIDETEDEANNIIKNKMRRLKWTRRFPKSIDSDNPHENEDPNNFENAQDADNRSLSTLGANLRIRKRRERAPSTMNEALIQLRKTSSEVSDMALYQNSIMAKNHGQQLSSSESEAEKLFKSINSEYQ